MQQKGFVQTASAAGNAIANKLGEEAVAKQQVKHKAAQEAADRADIKLTQAKKMKPH